MITTEQINEILYNNIKSVINHKHKADIINCIKAAYALASSEKDKEIAELKKEVAETNKTYEDLLVHIDFNRHRTF